jgi:hypothetical protein
MNKVGLYTSFKNTSTRIIRPLYFSVLLCLPCFLPGCKNPAGRNGQHPKIKYEADLNMDLLDIKASAYQPGDFHQHTTYTDGAFSFGHLADKNNEYNLEWWVNSEHGGAFNRYGSASGDDLGQTVYWTDYDPVPIKGKANNGKMWRWQSIAEYSYADIRKARQEYPSKTIIQGLEWNVPGHEHASTAILGNQFSSAHNADAIAEFEYKFDNRDLDDSGGLHNWTKSTNAGHEKALEAIGWMQSNYPRSGWIIPAHPERKGLYSIADFRDMNNAGPDVCFGFESMPGHQKSKTRGEYDKSDNAYGACTYGGTGLMAAKVGGLWDALLSEGRRWWLFANSDFHDVSGDFFPGEYQKTYLSIPIKGDPQSLFDGLRSGNAFVVTGDMIDFLDFTVNGKTMGQTADAQGKKVLITIFLRDPSGKNNNCYSSYTNPILDHIDIIAGELHGIIAKGNPDYTNDDVTSTTRVVARFDAIGGVEDSDGLVSRKWKELGNGYIMITYRFSKLDSDMYFRLRGTNLGVNIPNQTDDAGNPLPDTLLYPNDGARAFEDLWFYSNPVFVRK